MSSTPRMRDCRFSSVRPLGSPSVSGASDAARARWAASMGTVATSIPRLAARVTASATDPSLEYRDGMVTPWTWPGPRASTAMAATSEESMPPDSPMTASVKPFLAT